MFSHDAEVGVKCWDDRAKVVRRLASNGAPDVLAGAPVTTTAPVARDGTGEQAALNKPGAMAVGPDGSIVFIDGCDIRRLTLPATVTTIVVPCSTFNSGGPPLDMAVDGNGVIYFVTAHAVHKVLPSGVFIDLAGRPDDFAYVDANGSNARFTNLSGIVADAGGNLFVTDAVNPGENAIRRIDALGNVTTFATLSSHYRSLASDVPPADLRDAYWQRVQLGDLAIDREGNLYASDGTDGSDPLFRGSNVIWKIDAKGTATIFAGTPCLLKNGSELANCSDQPIDGTTTQGRFVRPTHIAVDGAGAVYVVDDGYVVRRVERDGTIGSYAGDYDRTRIGLELGALPGNLAMSAGPQSPALRSWNSVFATPSAPSGVLTTPITGVAISPAGKLYLSINEIILGITPAER